jgi:methionyl-tRNA formyltransferase
MAEKIRVVILTTKLPEDIWLINTLGDVCQIEGIVFPTGTRYHEYGMAHVLRKRIPRLGLINVANQALLVLYRLLVENRRDKKAAKEFFSSKPSQYIERKGIDILEVLDINSDQVRNFIRAKAPQLVVVSGAPLLKECILEAAEGRIINLHPGYAPQYRGRYGSFWPIYNKEPELVGATIHFVDKGVDTGRILLQGKVEFNPDDTLRTITYRQHKLGTELLVRCLQDFETYAGSAYRKTDCPDKNYIAPGLTHYLKGRRWLKKRSRAWKLSLPS